LSKTGSFPRAVNGQPPFGAISPRIGGSNNAVISGIILNKGHDLVSGNLVGEWCNIGADSNNLI
jgi:hypothetical protein